MDYLYLEFLIEFSSLNAHVMNPPCNEYILSYFIVRFKGFIPIYYVCRFKKRMIQKNDDIVP